MVEIRRGLLSIRGRLMHNSQLVHRIFERDISDTLDHFREVFTSTAELGYGPFRPNNAVLCVSRNSDLTN